MNALTPVSPPKPTSTRADACIDQNPSKTIDDLFKLRCELQAAKDRDDDSAIIKSMEGQIDLLEQQIYADERLAEAAQKDEGRLVLKVIPIATVFLGLFRWENARLELYPLSAAL